MCKGMKPIGGVYYNNVSPSFNRGIYEGAVRSLKAESHDNGVALEIPLGVLRNVRSDYGKQIRKQYESGNLKISRHEFLEKEIRNDGVVNTLDSVQKDNWLAVKVKEATSKGYAVARGGRTQSTLQCREAKQEEGESG